MRSLIPESVRIMALTAMATKSTRVDIMKVLRMVTPAIITVSPNKENIKYNVRGSPNTLEETFDGLLQELRSRRATMDRTIVYILSNIRPMFLYIYTYLVTSLGKEVTELLVFCWPCSVVWWTCLQHVPTQQ